VPTVTTIDSQTLLEGCANFRDLGGLPVPGVGATVAGRLYRSDSLHRLTQADIVRCADQLGIGLAIDLRSDHELELVGTAPVVEGMTLAHVPTVDATMQAPMEHADATSIFEGYRLMLDRSRANLARALETLAAEPTPAVFFCMAGKDRTGLLAALALGLVGVERDAIIDDYTRTTVAMPAIIARIEAEQPGAADRWEHLATDVLSALPQTMADTLDLLDTEHGGIEAYVRGAGLTDAGIDGIRSRLLEP
jgi:protein-tyrosine phosphatase